MKKYITQCLDKLGILLITKRKLRKYQVADIEKEYPILENKVDERTKELAEKNRDITSSIEYAKRIQNSILPSMKSIEQSIPNSFVLFLQKDNPFLNHKKNP